MFYNPIWHKGPANLSLDRKCPSVEANLLLCFQPLWPSYCWMYIGSSGSLHTRHIEWRWSRRSSFPKITDENEHASIFLENNQSGCVIRRKKPEYFEAYRVGWLVHYVQGIRADLCLDLERNPLELKLWLAPNIHNMHLALRKHNHTMSNRITEAKLIAIRVNDLHIVRIRITQPLRCVEKVEAYPGRI